jgi:hypothetical protein
MNLLIKQLGIIFFCFMFILLLQNIDDCKYKINRKTHYEKYKFPILISSFLGLLICYNHEYLFNNFNELINKNNIINDKIKVVTIETGMPPF